jgi:F-type H+-transporting ATPase subunit b
MRIDWLTVGAQIFNFLVLVFLLKRFLYAPVVEAMAAREKRIVDRLTQAAEREGRAQAQEQLLAERLADIEAQRDRMVADMRDEVDAQRKQLLDALRGEVAQQRSRWLGEVEREQEDLTRRLRGEIAESVLDISRRVLGDLAGADLERRVVESLIARLRSLGPEQRRALAQGEGSVVVTTANELDEAQRVELAEAVHSAMGAAEAGRAAVRIEWLRDADLLCGARLQADGLELAWSIDDHLGDLRARVAERLARSDA